MENKTGTKAGIQKFGAYLSGMVMPNISAFIAWGLITALFIATGWWPNEKLATMVGPMITYLLPLLIAYTGGKIVYDHRGGVVGAAAAMGVIVGTSIPMFLGAMLMGPLAAFLIKKIDGLFEGKIKSGFEMLINNFTAGILATVLAVAGFYVIGPVVEALNNVLASGVDAIINLGILPLVHLFVEPAKVLFLLESNPGPGLGILLAYMFFGKGISKASASSAAVIHFLGGIHEIYFPYILMKPILIVAAMAGGAAGTLTFSLLNVGLNAAPSPGSIFAYIAMTPRGDFFGMFLGVIVAAAVSFVVAAAILRSSKETEAADMDLAVSKMESMKGKESSVRSTLVTGSKDYRNVNKIIFACDAGMGSSAMGASILKKKVKEAGINDVDVTNLAINNLPSDVDLVVTHKDLTERARKMVPGAIHVSVDNFLGTNKYDDIVTDLKKSKM